MIDSLTQNFTFEFPWVGKSESTEDLGDNANADIEDKTISKGATLFEQQTSKDLPAVEENCCPELCLELSGEARNIAKDARKLSIDMSEISKEADMLNKKALEVSKICDVGIKESPGLLSSMVGM